MKGSILKWSIYKHDLDKNMKYLSVNNVCVPPAYTILCRGLEYLLKIPYFIQDYPYVAGI